MSTNTQRRKWAQTAIAAYAERTGRDRFGNEEDFQDCISDLIGDLGHVAEWAGRRAVRTYDAMHVYKRGIGMYSAEAREGDDPQANDVVEITTTKWMKDKGI